jgi:hypothetical protein
MSMKPFCLVLLLSLPVPGQKPEFDFYRDARDKKPEAYASELRKASVPENEIARRLELLQNHRPLL